MGVHVAQELMKLIPEESEDYNSGRCKHVRIKSADFSASVHISTSMHDVDLPRMIKIGKKLMPDAMPLEIVILAVEVAEVEVFTEEMTAEVKEVVPKILCLVLAELGKKSPRDILE